MGGAGEAEEGGEGGEEGEEDGAVGQVGHLVGSLEGAPMGEGGLAGDKVDVGLGGGDKET